MLLCLQSKCKKGGHVPSTVQHKVDRLEVQHAGEPDGLVLAFLVLISVIVINEWLAIRVKLARNGIQGLHTPCMVMLVLGTARLCLMFGVRCAFKHNVLERHSVNTSSITSIATEVDEMVTANTRIAPHGAGQCMVWSGPVLPTELALVI